MTIVDELRELLLHFLPFIKPHSTIELYHDSECRLSLRGEPDALYVKWWNADEQRETCFKMDDPGLLDAICNNSILKLDPHEHGWHVAGRRTVAA